MKYDAFISYSHAADGKLAPAVQLALHQIAKPWYQLRALNIFRDKTNMSLSPSVWNSIENALKRSNYFVLLASPIAAQSEWVKKEIDYWLGNRSIEQLLIVLTDGTIKWNGATGDFDWEQTNALPFNLKGIYKSEPLYINFAEVRSSDDLSLKNPDFKKKMIALAAAIHEKEVNNLVSEEISQHKKTNRVRNGAVISLITLVIISGFATKKAFEQTKIAEQQKEEAVRQTMIASQQKKKATDALIEILLQRADVYSYSKDYELALEELNEAIRMDSTNDKVLQKVKEIKIEQK